jgi:peptidoglycan/xylan/chitin deacetylase (PgdA/CDA1 family)
MNDPKAMPILDRIVRHLGSNTVTVLSFHKVPQKIDPLVPSDTAFAQFEQILDVVMDCCTVVPLADVAAGLRNSTVPKNAACITFDDGYDGWLQRIAPVLLRRNAHATFFLTTGQFDGVPMWHERTIEAVRSCKSTALQVPGIDMPIFQMHHLKGQIACIAWLQHYLKYQPIENRNAVLLTLEAICGLDSSALKCMAASDARVLHSKGFAIGSHTVNHPILTKTTMSEAAAEIGGARDYLEGLIAGQVNSFAYPNGRPNTDFLSEHIALVRRAGYTHAVTTQAGVVRSGTPIYQIPRFTPWGPGRTRMLAQLLRNQTSHMKTLSES